MENTRRKIMLVDDDPECRLQGRAILKDIYEVYPLPSSSKLFDMLGKFSPDLILLDINMPICDGFETLKRLKSNPRYEHIPVIFLSASKDKKTVLKGSALGAAGFMTKPFTADDLFEHVERCLNPHKEENTPSKKMYFKNEKPVVLAIDDSPDVLKSVFSMLRDNYKVFALPKPDKLKDFLAKTTPDIFLLDYQMPDISGFDLIPVIREFPEHKETPIIFLTSAGTIEHLTVAVDLGASDFIVKPFEMDVLRSKVARSIARHPHHE
jgi:DNA-binding response OmpR family regulator